eukprot:scaffold147430_cov19-Tisochrysis_lutea.AAC.1
MEDFSQVIEGQMENPTGHTHMLLHTAVCLSLLHMRLFASRCCLPCKVQAHVCVTLLFAAHCCLPHTAVCLARYKRMLASHCYSRGTCTCFCTLLFAAHCWPSLAGAAAEGDTTPAGAGAGAGLSWAAVLGLTGCLHWAPLPAVCQESTATQ